MTTPDFSKNSYGQAPPPQYAPAPPPGYGYGAPPAPYGQAPYGQAPYGQAPYGGAVQKPVGWFIVNWLFFWPLAIYSLVSAWGTIDRALFAGDIQGAQYQAGRVRKFGIIALCLGVAWILLWIIIAVSVASTCDPTYANNYRC